MARKKKNATRKDGLIAVQVYLGLDENGKRRYKTAYGRSQKEADERADEVRAAMRKGLDVTAGRDTFGDWARRWLNVKAPEVSHSQADVYRSRVDYINAFLKDAPIAKVKSIDLQEIINSLSESNPNTGKPASKRLLEITKSALVQIFALAIDNRVLDYNPASAIKLPRSAPASKRRALTDSEQQWIISTDHRAKRAAMIMMFAGLRRGELIPLTWNDIDFEEKTISVNKSVERINNKFFVKEGAKTVAGIRTVDIPGILVEYLLSEKRDGIFVCGKSDGAMHTDASWKRMWESYLLEINFMHGDFSPFQNKPRSKFDPGGVPFVIPHITPHWLRHTFATLLYFAGVDILSAKELLGHADIKMTLEIYTHLDKQYKRKSISKLDDYLSYASKMQVVKN